MQVLEFIENNDDVCKLFDIYKIEFTEAFRKIKKNEYRKKLAVKQLSQIIFFKWFYSALIDNTYFSPANIFNRIIFEKFKDEVAVLPNIVPIFIENELRDFKMEYRVFTEDNNGLFNDIQFLQSFFTNKRVDLSKLKLDQVYKDIQDNLFFKDDFYLLQIFNLAAYFNAFSYENEGRRVFITGNDFDVDFFNNNNSYKKIIDFWVKIASEVLGFLNLDFYNVIYLKRNIKNKGLIQKFLDRFLKALEIDKDDFVDHILGINKDESKSHYDNYFIITSYLVKFYILPLSYFIPIIQPCYLSKMDFDIVFREAEAVVNKNCSSYDILSDPFIIYDLTYFGNKLMKRVDKTKFQDVFDEKVDVNEILEIRNEIYKNPQMQNFWESIGPKELEDFIKFLEQEGLEEKSVKKVHKEGNVIYLFNKNDG